MKALAVIAALAVFSSASAQDKPLTVEQCIGVLAGLNALNCAGQQLGGQCEKDAKQYKLGGARMTIALDISALGPTETAYRKAVQGYAQELVPIPPPPTDGKPDQFASQRVKQNAEFAAFQMDQLGKPCSVSPGRLKVSDLRVGDGSDENAIPPSVIAALAPILDK